MDNNMMLLIMRIIQAQRIAKANTKHVLRTLCGTVAIFHQRARVLRFMFYVRFRLRCSRCALKLL